MNHRRRHPPLLRQQYLGSFAAGFGRVKPVLAGPVLA